MDGDVRHQLLADPDFWECVRLNGSPTSTRLIRECGKAIRERSLAGSSEELAKALEAPFRAVELLSRLRQRYSLTVKELNPFLQSVTDETYSTAREILR